jgi:hypothetical protein
MTEREAVLNKALTGLELKELILRYFRKMLDQDGMLTQYTAYGRCAYDIRLRIHTDNIMNRTAESTITSRAEARNLMDKQPGLAAVEAGVPLRDASPDSAVSSAELIRNVNSPNAERLNAGLPVTVDTREQDGSKVQKQVTYPLPEAGEVAESTGMTDTSAATRKDWDLQPLAPATPPTPPTPPKVQEPAPVPPAPAPAKQARSAK